MILRPYQQRWKSEVYEAFRSGTQSVLAQLPTGAGKTVIFSSIIQDGYNIGRRCLILAHRGELIQQSADKLWNGFGINCGIIKAGYEPKPYEQVQVASVQTLINRKLFFPVDIVIIDEAHHMQSRNTYGKIRQMVLDLKPTAKFLGVTATPCRTSGAGFKSVFETLIQGATVQELITDGYLVKPRYFVAPINLDGIKISAGDYNVGELDTAYRSRIPAGELVKNWKRIANNRKTIGFAITVEHSNEIVEQFKAEGVAAAHIDGKTPQEERRRLLRQFSAGEILVLYNVGVFDEGFDCPDIEAVQLARPSKSLIKFMQMCGRALRPAPGKSEALVLDHSGLLAEHNLIETPRQWTLGGVEEDKKKELRLKDARSGELYRPKELPFDVPMEHVELVEIDAPRWKYDEKAMLARDFAVLSRFAVNRNYHKLWVWHQLARKVTRNGSYEENIRKLAEYCCEAMGYNNGKAHYLAKQKINEEINGKNTND